MVKIKNILSNIKNFFNANTPLIKMQLKDKLDLKSSTSKKQSLFKLIWSIVGFILITTAFYLLFALVTNLGFFSFIQVFNFRAFLCLMILLLTLSFIGCVVNVTKTLYFAKDNPVLLTLPVKNGVIFTSKLTVCFVYELIKNSSYLLPALIAYGLVMGLPIVYYLWSIFVLILITILFTSVSGLVSIPAMYVVILLKKHRVIEFIIATVLIISTLILTVYLINLIPADIDIVRDWGRIYWGIQDFLEFVSSRFIIFDLFVQFLTGMKYNSFVFNLINIINLTTFGLVLGIIFISIISTYLLSKPLFLKMASTPFEYKRNNNKSRKKNQQKPIFLSAALQQAKIIFRTANLIYSIVAIAIITPIAILLQNRIIASMDTRLAGDYMGIAFNLLILLLLVLSSNAILSSVYSREGNSGYLNKVQPVHFVIPLTAKLVLNATVTVVSIIVSVVIINFFAKLETISCILLCLAIIFVYIAHLLWSAELDVMNPQNAHYQTTGDNPKNPNEAKSTLLAFIISALFAFITFFLVTENIKVAFIKIFFIALALLIIRIYLYYTKINVYFKEK